jgi:2-polyprenyl-3-methyl-5-hydroxy-6-metoxy-1,4-benzoquinol methylase
MPLQLDFDLSSEQQKEMQAIPAIHWFTNVEFRNAVSPVHPDAKLVANNEMKLKMTEDWIRQSVKGKTVLDLFSANGAFSVLAAQAGAKKVVGVEFSPERVECARWLASTVKSDCPIEFMVGDVYKLRDYFDEPFDVVLCLGGLYHIGDPPFVLEQIGKLTREALIVQTSQVLFRRGNWAQFLLRRYVAEGKTSIRKGFGTWHATPGCIREWIEHGGFKVQEERLPGLRERRRYPWYLAKCAPL